MMNITDKLRLELFLREQLTKHGDQFYIELARILEKIQLEQNEDFPGRPSLKADIKAK